MKSTIRALTVAIFAVLALVAAACGGDEPTTAAPTSVPVEQPTAAPAATEQPTAAPVATAAPAATAQPTATPTQAPPPRQVKEVAISSLG